MARTSKLKVFRTVAGFADAYVAAPSRKAALQAWGSDKDLFARGLAEEVTDPALTEAPLASPGTVVRRSRGTAAEQLAALPPARADPKVATRTSSEDPAPPHAAADRPKPRPKPGPKPSRADLDAAEAALAAAQEARRAALDTLANREAALARERRDTERAQQDQVRAAESARDESRRAYDTAMRRWRAEQAA